MFYFSLENIRQDPFLISNMNADRFVTLDLVAGFQKVSALTQDRALIVDVIRSIGGLEVRLSM